MTTSVDYSGEFDPEFSLDNLSRDTLLKLLQAYTEYMLRIDGHWYLTVMAKWGNEEAFDCDVKVWEKAQMYELRSMSSLLNIRGDDVATVMKAIQASPWMGIYEYTIDLKNKDHAVATYFKCPTLLALEKEGTGREQLICRQMEPKLMRMIAHFFNPKITVIALKIPPRTDYSDCCCQWEFKLER
jgi:hypothetical protein